MGFVFNHPTRYAGGSVSTNRPTKQPQSNNNRIKNHKHLSYENRKFLQSIGLKLKRPIVG